jgi:hypothetical protein
MEPIPNLAYVKLGIPDSDGSSPVGRPPAPVTKRARFEAEARWKLREADGVTELYDLQGLEARESVLPAEGLHAERLRGAAGGAAVASAPAR